jgi:hypothetical protein
MPTSIDAEDVKDLIRAAEEVRLDLREDRIYIAIPVVLQAYQALAVEGGPGGGPMMQIVEQLRNLVYETHTSHHAGLDP